MGGLGGYVAGEAVRVTGTHHKKTVWHPGVGCGFNL